MAHRSHGMRDNRHKLKRQMLKMDRKKIFFAMRAAKQWSRLSSEAVQSLSLEAAQAYWIKPEQSESWSQSQPYFGQEVRIKVSWGPFCPELLSDSLILPRGCLNSYGIQEDKIWGHIFIIIKGLLSEVLKLYKGPLRRKKLLSVMKSR